MQIAREQSFYNTNMKVELPEGVYLISEDWSVLQAAVYAGLHCCQIYRLAVEPKALLLNVGTTLKETKTHQYNNETETWQLVENKWMLGAKDLGNDKSNNKESDQ